LRLGLTGLRWIQRVTHRTFLRRGHGGGRRPFAEKRGYGRAEGWGSRQPRVLDVDERVAHLHLGQRNVRQFSRLSNQLFRFVGDGLVA
jgi:hypothetical protein